VTPERRVSPWWMALPAALFVLNFIGGVTSGGGDRSNEVYDIAGLVASLAGYAMLAARLSGQPVGETLAVRRVPLRPALIVAVVGLVAILISEAILDPIFNGGDQQGIEPTHSPQTSHQWVAVAVAAAMLVVVAPVAEELIFRGLGFAAFGPVAVPVTSLLFAVARGRGGGRRPAAGRDPPPHRIGAAGDRGAHGVQRARARDRVPHLVTFAWTSMAA
jgi:membrane protease YdiL (CAAX protease family)